MSNRETTDEYISQLYITLKGWNLLPASIHTENQLTKFENEFKEVVHTHKLRKK
jgi:hypothetical protein